MSSDKRIFHDKGVIKSNAIEYKFHLCMGIFNIDNLKTPEHFGESELRYLNDLFHLKRKTSYTIGRYVGKHAVAGMLTKKILTDISIVKGIHNFPVVHVPEAGGVQVSITHSGNFAAAVSFSEECPMGIDLELMTSASFKSAESILEEDERKLFAHCESRLSWPVFSLMLWTAKESVAKAMRTGFTLPLKVYEIKSIEKKHSGWICIFKHIIQFWSVSVIMDQSILSIAYPKNTDINLNLKGMEEFV